MTLLALPLLSRLRRNHGLEHATLTVLAQRFPSCRLAGLSFPGGFYILGKIATDELRQAVAIALARLNNGERHLAVHPHCGTNYAVSGLAAGLLAWLGLAGTRTRRERLERLPLVVTLVTLAFIFTQPLGPLVQQRIMTDGDPQGLTIVDVSPLSFGRLPLHRVTTQG
ncbi:MAG: DUF6391 domain-containing protein [Anaerolineales bacterium]